MIHCGIVQSGRKSNGAKGQIRSTVQAQNALRAIQGSGIYKIWSAFAGLLRRLEQKTELSTKAVTILGGLSALPKRLAVGIVPQACMIPSV